MLKLLFAVSLLIGASPRLSESKSITNNAKGWYIHVSIHVFSGRPNPTWRIPDYHPDYPSHLEKMKTLESRPLPSKLGYQGFTLTHVQPGKDVTFGGAYNVTVTSNPAWEMFLLEKLEMEGPLKKHAKDTIRQREGYRRKRKSYVYDPFSNSVRPKNTNPFETMPSHKQPNYLYYKPTTVDPLNDLTPDQIERLARLLGVKDVFGHNKTTTPIPPGPTRFEPQKWNHFPVETTNNCYNYANNEVTYTIAQPGKKHHCSMSIYNPSGKSVQRAAECDGLKTLTAPDSNTLPEHDLNLVALVFWPPRFEDDLWDFHWYRLDVNKHWSHKPGKTAATNVDNSRRAITDPRHADRGHYTEFVAFMQTSPDRVKVE